MAIEDPANAAVYKERAHKYEGWRTALYEAERRRVGSGASGSRDYLVYQQTIAAFQLLRLETALP